MAGLRSIFGDPLLRILVPALWVFVLVGEAVNVVEVFLVTDEIGLGPSGLWLACWQPRGPARSSVPGSPAGCGPTGPGPRAVLAGMAAIGVSCVLMGLAGGVVPLVIGAVAIGFGSGMLNAAVSTLVVTRSAEPVRGRVIAALNGHGPCLQPAGPAARRPRRRPCSGTAAAPSCAVRRWSLGRARPAGGRGVPARLRVGAAGRQRIRLVRGESVTSL